MESLKGYSIVLAHLVSEMDLMVRVDPESDLTQLQDSWHAEIWCVHPGKYGTCYGPVWT